jgi:glycosyltransferase involved in cell wall biosynthesis
VVSEAASRKEGEAGLAVSVVIPAADEAANIGGVLERVHETLRRSNGPYEVLVVIPRPDDPTGAVAEKLGARVLAQKRPGYGGALKEGLLAARGEYVVTLDGDGSHPPEMIADLLKRRLDAEVVVCSRYVEGGSAASTPGRLSICASTQMLSLMRSK